MMKPASPWSWSHHRRAEVMKIGMVAFESGRAGDACDWEGEGEQVFWRGGSENARSKESEKSEGSD